MMTVIVATVVAGALAVIASAADPRSAPAPLLA